LSLNVHETNFLRSIKSQEKNGFVKSAMSPVGSKTWRIRVEGGFKCMSIPHGFCRSVLTSRFENGKICTLDFNAIDYRCLVEAVNDSDLTRFYAGVLDFHARTASLFGDVTPKLRNDIKKITYTHIYGGALDTLNVSTGLSHFELKEMLIKLDKLFKPITHFRNELVVESKKNGFLDTPGYHRIKIDDDFSPGKVIGLYAQTFSSFVFGKALFRADEIVRDIKSKMIFTVYDEIVFDLHPEEIQYATEIKREIEKATGFVTKMKIGENYEDVE
jgi:DNA polymerase I